jgi:transcriptional regulator with XRE-family HTH domain
MRPFSKGAQLLKSKVEPEITQERLAEVAGVTKQAVWAWTQGISRPSSERQALLERVLGVPAAAWKERAAPEEKAA